MRIKFDEIERISQKGDRLEKIESIIEGCREGDPIMLSDLLARKNDIGGFINAVVGNHQYACLLDERPLMKWKIQVLRDEWGNTPCIGDVVVKREQKKVLDRRGKKVAPDVISASIIDGSYDKIHIKKTVYDIDRKGCITCTFKDAVSFINIKGVHPDSGRPITPRSPHSKEPQDAPNGSKLHVWYQLYKEMTKEAYERLPDIPTRSGPRRGIDPIERRDDNVRVEDVPHTSPMPIKVRPGQQNQNNQPSK